MAVVMGRGGVPTSVLLAVLAAAGLLALAPALVRRYDATERLAAERAQSTARVLDRRRRRRTVPGPRPRYGPREPVRTPVDEVVRVPAPRRSPESRRVATGHDPGYRREVVRVPPVARRGAE